MGASSGSPAGSSSSAVAPPPKAPEGMVRVAGATFAMGSDRRPNEAPVHDVTVATFFLDRLETTVADYRACVEAKACAEPAPPVRADQLCNWGQAGKDKHPINCVGWEEANTYCRFRGKRLPTEPEWELAARGTDGRRFPWSNEPPTEGASAQLCWNRLKLNAGTCEVGSFPKGASPSGALDLSGNVSEWVDAPLCKYDAPRCNTTDLVGRGGSWDYGNPDNLTTTSRAGGPRDHRRDLLGVRCAKSADMR